MMLCQKEIIGDNRGNDNWIRRMMVTAQYLEFMACLGSTVWDAAQPTQEDKEHSYLDTQMAKVKV